MRPARLERVCAWELRTAWALRREVVLVMGERGRVRGYVQHVAPTDAFALVWDGRGEVHLPCALVATVRRPHFSEPLDGEPVGAVPVPEVRQAPPPMDGQLALDLWVPTLC
jgi:hypothetical protein